MDITVGPGAGSDYSPVLDRIVSSIQRGVAAGAFCSTWTAFEHITIDRSKWHPRWTQLEALKQASEPSDHLPYVLQYMSSQLSGLPFLRETWEPFSVQMNGLYARIEHPELSVDKLDLVGVRQVIIAPPTTTQRHPSGLWVLTRGPKHPANQAFEDLAAWVESTDAGPLVLSWAGNCGRADIATVELHASMERAMQLVGQLRTHDPDYAGCIIKLAGPDLLRCLADYDALLWERGIMVDLATMPVTSLAAILRERFATSSTFAVGMAT